MMNLAEQLRSELTERAKQSESCKKHLLDWVMDQFRNGENPVIIYCKNTAHFHDVSKAFQERMEFKYEGKSVYYDFSYKDGKHYAHKSGYREKEIDITDLPDAQRFACDGKDESDKRLFLEGEGFHVFKTWEYGKGDILKITY